MPDSAVVLQECWKDLRQRVDARLEAYLREIAQCPDELREAMRYSLLGGGKRLRPVLLLLACEACGGNVERALPAASALEMIHTYSLVHDDLPAMDNDDFRRGRPTSHVVFGEATAILAGDALLTLAFEVLARDVTPPAVAAACCAELASAAGAGGMVGGQMLDLAGEGRDDVTLEGLERLHRMKTGRLLGVAPVLGGRIAGASDAVLSSLARYGNCVGLAFQIADDLLDVCGDPDVMGKGVRKDAALGKRTYPALVGLEASERRARQLVEEACRSLAPLGRSAERLESLAHFVIERDH